MANYFLAPDSKFLPTKNHANCVIHCRIVPLAPPVRMVAVLAPLLTFLSLLIVFWYLVSFEYMHPVYWCTILHSLYWWTCLHQMLIRLLSRPFHLYLFCYVALSTCTPCSTISRCSTCSNNQTLCLSCQSDYYLDYSTSIFSPYQSW